MTITEKQMWLSRCRGLYRRLAELDAGRYGGKSLAANIAAIKRLAERDDYATIRHFAIQSEALVERRAKRIAESH